MENFIDKAKAVMIGHAIGDALGVPVEFRTREYLDKYPVTDMTGYGTHPVPKGAWSDDTSMALCALESLSVLNLDYDDIMLNFGKWYYDSQFTATGEMFDVGNTCSEAIHRYFKESLPYDKCGLSNEYSNGNGSLMRIHPFVLYLAHRNPININSFEVIHTASALTHAHPRSKAVCGAYSFVLWELLENPCKASIKTGLNKAKEAYSMQCKCFDEPFTDVYEELSKFERLYGDIENLSRDSIISDGYAVHTLEAGIWCLLTTDSYKECVLKAVNLGDDTDTTAAVAGGLAGALYGYNAIPEEWRNTLLKREYIEELCQKTFKSIG